MSQLRSRAYGSISIGVIGIISLIIALVTSWHHHQLTIAAAQFFLPASLSSLIVAVVLLISSRKPEVYLFQDTAGTEHLHSERPIRVGQIWHCNNPDGTAIQIKGYIVVIRPNGWSNTGSYVLNPVEYSWKEIRAYSAYHSDPVELRDSCDRGLRVSFGEMLTIINSCDSWKEYKHQTFHLGVTMCLARLQAQFGRQTQPSPNAAAMRQTLTHGISGFRDQKQVAKWEESARFEFKRLYPGSSLTAEEMSPEPTQPPGIVA